MPTRPRKTRVGGIAPPPSSARVKAPRSPRASGRSDAAVRPDASGVSGDEVRAAETPEASSHLGEALKAERSAAAARPRLRLLQGPDAVADAQRAGRRSRKRGTATKATGPKRQARARTETAEPGASSTETSEVTAPTKRARHAADIAAVTPTDRATSTGSTKRPKRSKAAAASGTEQKPTAGTPPAEAMPAPSDVPIPTSTPHPRSRRTTRSTHTAARGVSQPVSASPVAPATIPVQEPEPPHVTGLWRAARATRGQEGTAAPRVRVVAPAPVSIQVLTVPGRDPRIPSRADVVPPALVLLLQLVVGLIVGANPLVLLAAAASIVAVAYLVRRSITLERARVVRRPHARPISEVPVIQPSVGSALAQAPSAPPPAAPTAAPIAAQPVTPAVPLRPGSDLRWLWGTILRDPTARPPRRDRR